MHAVVTKGGWGGDALVWATVLKGTVVGANGGGGMRACGPYPYGFRVDLIGFGVGRRGEV
jgi:hypothetical protein